MIKPLDFRDVTTLDPLDIMPMQVHLDADTRIRVYSEQLQDSILENITRKDNILFHAALYHKYGSRLLQKFPGRYNDLANASVRFWARVQEKVKRMEIKSPIPL